MTGFTTRCCTSVGDRIVRLVCVLGLVVTPLLAAASGENRVRYAEIVANEQAYVVNADFDLDLNPTLIDAISKGVSLYFVVEFQIERPRWYWFDEVVVTRRLQYRLNYHAITRTYRLSVGNLHQSFESLDAALRTLTRLRNWRIVEVRGLDSGTSYNAALRMRHDTSMLPRPFQVTAIGSRDWNLTTEWTRWTFLASPVR